MYYIVGLGNPGKKYEGTRHNIGREVVELFIDREHLSDLRNDKGSRSLQAQGNISSHDVLCILPEAYMNNSGGSVAPYVSKENISELIVVQDDIDLPLGEIKIVKGRGSGGHNGVLSIEESVGSKDFIRIKIGVAKRSLFTKKMIKPKSGSSVVKHVLGKYGTFEKKTIEESKEKSIEILHYIISKGVFDAMNKFN